MNLDYAVEVTPMRDVTSLSTMHIVNNEVKHWRNHFVDIAEGFKVFDELTKAEKVKELQLIGGCTWYYFSRKVPRLLSVIASQCTDKEVKENIEYVVKDELGFGDDNLNHALLFRKSLESVGYHFAKTSDIDPFIVNKDVDNLIEMIKLNNNEAFNLGLILGVEIVAYENVYALLDIVSQGQVDTLKNDLFFSIHLVAEDEHINLYIKLY